ncbi:SECISBP2L family protein [Megaselia abdita]
MELSREEIREKRRERRKIKKENEKLLKEDIARKKLYQKGSQKVQVLDGKTFDKFNNTSTSESKPIDFKSKRRKDLHNPEFSLIDYLAKKKKKKRHERKIFLRTSQTKRKGKVKTKKHVSSLKKLIRRFRSLKVEEKEKVPEKTTEKYIHSNTFRSYCDNTTSSLLSQQTEDLLRKLNEFQRRALQKNEIKAKAHKRFVIGFREVKNHLLVKKLKLVIIATDCEKCDIEGGIDDVIESMKTFCRTDQEVPCCFSMKRRQLAYCLYRKVPVSCVGILSYDGAQDIFHSFMKTLEEEKLNYVKVFG